MRDLSIKGSILLAETEGLSGLVYMALALAIPQSVIKEVDTFLFNFIWKNRQHYLKKNTILCNPIEDGGLNVLDFSTANCVFKNKWIKNWNFVDLEQQPRCVSFISGDSSWKDASHLPTYPRPTLLIIDSRNTARSKFSQLRICSRWRHKDILSRVPNPGVTMEMNTTKNQDIPLLFNGKSHS